MHTKAAGCSGSSCAYLKTPVAPAKEAKMVFRPTRTLLFLCIAMILNPIQPAHAPGHLMLAYHTTIQCCKCSVCIQICFCCTPVRPYNVLKSCRTNSCRQASAEYLLPSLNIYAAYHLFRQKIFTMLQKRGFLLIKLTLDTLHQLMQEAVAQPQLWACLTMCRKPSLSATGLSAESRKLNSTTTPLTFGTGVNSDLGTVKRH